jgi:hypothetical protein
MLIATWTRCVCARACARVRVRARVCLCERVFNLTNHPLTPNTHIQSIPHARMYASTRAHTCFVPDTSSTKTHTRRNPDHPDNPDRSNYTHTHTLAHTRTHKHRGMQTILTGLPRNHSPPLSYSCSQNPLMRHLKRKRKQKRRRVVFACSWVHSCVCVCMLKCILVYIARVFTQGQSHR